MNSLISGWRKAKFLLNLLPLFQSAHEPLSRTQIRKKSHFKPQITLNNMNNETLTFTNRACDEVKY